jgi:hypothetical protein
MFLKSRQNMPSSGQNPDRPDGETKIERRRRLGRARQKRFYARQRAGLGLAKIRYSVEAINMLVGSGWLPAPLADDPGVIEKAIEEWMQDTALAFCRRR